MNNIGNRHTTAAQLVLVNRFGEHRGVALGRLCLALNVVLTGFASLRNPESEAHFPLARQAALTAFEALAESLSAEFSITPQELQATITHFLDCVTEDAIDATAEHFAIHRDEAIAHAEQATGRRYSRKGTVQ